MSGLLVFFILAHLDPGVHPQGVGRGCKTAKAVTTAPSIRVDPEGEIALSANRQLTVLGTLEAAAGHIVLKQPELAHRQ